MSDLESERARATAEDLADMLSAFELELSALERDAPGVGPLREAVGTALAQVSFWISDRNAEHRRITQIVH